MQSVIAKAKQHKHDRQEIKRVRFFSVFYVPLFIPSQATDNLTEDLDEEFKAIRGLLMAESDKFEAEV